MMQYNFKLRIAICNYIQLVCVLTTLMSTWHKIRVIKKKRTSQSGIFFLLMVYEGSPVQWGQPCNLPPLFLDNNSLTPQFFT